MERQISLPQNSQPPRFPATSAEALSAAPTESGDFPVALVAIGTMLAAALRSPSPRRANGDSASHLGRQATGDRRRATGDEREPATGNRKPNCRISRNAWRCANLRNGDALTHSRTRALAAAPGVDHRRRGGAANIQVC